MSPQAETRALRSRLRETGLRATAARVAVLRSLEEADGPLSHAEVYGLVEDAGFDRATVYRNLIDLTEVGLARRYDLGDHVWRFELAEEADAHSEEAHPHFVCNECGIIECLPDGSVKLEAMRGTPRSLRRSRVDVQLRGLCDACL